MDESMVSASDLDRMTPSDRRASFLGSIVEDASVLPQRLQERMRRQAERVAARDRMVPTDS